MWRDAGGIHDATNREHEFQPRHPSLCQYIPSPPFPFWINRDVNLRRITGQPSSRPRPPRAKTLRTPLSTWWSPFASRAFTRRRPPGLTMPKRLSPSPPTPISPLPHLLTLAHTGRRPHRFSGLKPCLSGCVCVGFNVGWAMPTVALTRLTGITTPCETELLGWLVVICKLGQPPPPTASDRSMRNKAPC